MIKRNVIGIVAQAHILNVNYKSIKGGHVAGRGHFIRAARIKGKKGNACFFINRAVYTGPGIFRTTKAVLRAENCSNIYSAFNQKIKDMRPVRNIISVSILTKRKICGFFTVSVKLVSAEKLPSVLQNNFITHYSRMI